MYHRLSLYLDAIRTPTSDSQVRVKRGQGRTKLSVWCSVCSCMAGDCEGGMAELIRLVVASGMEHQKGGGWGGYRASRGGLAMASPCMAVEASASGSVTGTHVSQVYCKCLHVTFGTFYPRRWCSWRPSGSTYWRGGQWKSSCCSKCFSRPLSVPLSLLLPCTSLEPAVAFSDRLPFP